MALTAVAVGLTSNSFVARSCLGKYDTDCLNVTFSLSIAYCCLLFATTKGKQRYTYAALGAILAILFLWWWDQAPYVVAALTLFPILIAIIFFHNPSQQWKNIFWCCLGIATVALLTWPDPIRNFWEAISNYYYYIFANGNAKNGFPSMATIIGEQRDMSFNIIVARSTNSLLAFVLATVGLIWFFRDKFKEALFVVAPFSLALLSFAGERFMIFLAPAIAIGTGYLLFRLKQYTANNRLFYLTTTSLLIGYILWCSFIGGASFASPFPPQTIAGMEQIRATTPPDSVVWTPCDNGYPLMYWAERATVCDGQLHGGAISVYNAIPLATSDPRLGANFIRFYLAHGPDGLENFFRIIGDRAKGLSLLKQILSVGPPNTDPLLAQIPETVQGAQRNREQWLRFFFPPHSRPVYLFIDWGQMLANYWISWLGTWDINKENGKSTLPGKIYNHITVNDSTISSRTGSMRVNIKNGILTRRDGEKIPLSSITVRNGGTNTNYEYGDRKIMVGKVRGSYRLDVFTEQHFALLMGTEASKQLINSLFWLNTIPPSQYLRPVLINTPDYQLWEVIGDQFTQ